MDQWTTSDLTLAAWIACRVGGPISAEKAPSQRSPWCLFTFDDAEACRRVAIEYLNSEAYLFDSAIRAIRKVSFGFDWGNAHGKEIWSTRELSLAAFSVVRGSTLSGVTQEENGGGRSFFRFSFSSGDPNQIKADWETSEARIFDEQVRRLKRLA